MIIRSGLSQDKVCKLGLSRMKLYETSTKQRKCFVTLNQIKPVVCNLITLQQDDELTKFWNRWFKTINWCWLHSTVDAQMGRSFYIEKSMRSCRTNLTTAYPDMSHTSGTYRNTWTDGFRYRNTMLFNLHHCQHLN